MRLGLIGYVNNLPVDLALKKGLVNLPRGIQITEGHPREVSRKLIDGGLDAACVSSITYLANMDELVLLPEAVIASKGTVDSVLLYSKRPFDLLSGRRIAITEESSTGAALLRILLEGFRRLAPDYVRAPGDLKAMLAEADAGLVIGDAALRSLSDPAHAGILRMDLGSAWERYTRVPMVYAVWAARRERYERDPESVKSLAKTLRSARRWGAVNKKRVVEEAAAASGVEAATIEAYYRNLHHAFGEEERAGLVRFSMEAEKLGIVENGTSARLEASLS